MNCLFEFQFQNDNLLSFRFRNSSLQAFWKQGSGGQLWTIWGMGHNRVGNCVGTRSSKMLWYCTQNGMERKICILPGTASCSAGYPFSYLASVSHMLVSAHNTIFITIYELGMICMLQVCAWSSPWLADAKCPGSGPWMEFSRCHFRSNTHNLDILEFHKNRNYDGFVLI